MRWEFDELCEEWDLHVDALGFQVHGEAIASLHVDKHGDFWYINVFAESMPGRFEDLEVAKARAVAILCEKLRDALVEIPGSAREPTHVAAADSKESNGS